MAVAQPLPLYDLPHVHAPSPTHTLAELTTMEDLEKELPSEENALSDEAEVEAEAAHARADFPDGGLRAWLVVFGVRLRLVYAYDVILISLLGNVHYIQHVRRSVYPIRAFGICSFRPCRCSAPA
jgi:hypothetical protein